MIKLLGLILILATVANVIIADEAGEDCMVTNPIGNTIFTAGDKMKIAWANSHAPSFSTITLVQSDGTKTPIVIAENVDTSLGHINVPLPRTLIPSNSYFLTLGTAPYHCQSGNLRVIGASSEIPDPDPPGARSTPTSPGQFPTTESVASAVPMIPAVFLVVILLASFIFTLT